MDLPCKANSNASGDDESDRRNPPKRLKPDFAVPNTKPKASCPQIHPPNQSTEAPVPGRYISKRERVLMSSNHVTPDPNPRPPLPPPPVLGNIFDAYLPHHILPTLRGQVQGSAGKGRMPGKLSLCLNGHRKAVNAISWSPSHAHLLVSAGMDKHVRVWNVWSKEDKKAHVFSYHHAAVKEVRWSPLGQYILSCGFDCCSRIVDIEKGIETQNFREDQAVTTVKFHPANSNLFLSGGSKGLLKLWDIREGKAVHEYVRRLGLILDVEFMIDANRFISSSDVSNSNFSENSLIVWDVSREVPLSNQVYAEAYTCPCIRCHPSEPFFVAQSNGNYIAIFSTKHPYRLDKYKRYESHGVSGFPIKCEFSVDGETLATGSSEGNIYFYSVQSSHRIKKIKAYDQACVDVAFHPLIPNVIASCSWSGDISVLE